jgi:hypothetical protein
MTFRFKSLPKKLDRTTVAMLEFVPREVVPSTHGNQQHLKRIAIRLDGSLYRSYTSATGIVELKFTGMAFARNSICFGGILINVSLISLSRSYRAVRLGRSHQYCLIPRQTKHIGHRNKRKESIQFIAFESGSQLTRIDTFPFKGFRSICIPASVEILSPRCFAGCQQLSSLTFEADSKLAAIEEEVFSCPSLTSVSIPASVETICSLSFAKSSVSKIAIGEGNVTFAFCGDCLINVPASSVVRYFGDQEAIALTGDLKSLCTGYFSPSSLTFEPGSKLSRIEDHAFSHCSILKSISIPASVESLGDQCFYECSSLSSVTFGSGSKLVGIEARAFATCPRLKSISIPSSVESFGDQCFYECRSLSSVTFESGHFVITIDDCDSDIDRLGSSLASHCERFSYLVHGESFP